MQNHCQKFTYLELIARNLLICTGNGQKIAQILIIYQKKIPRILFFYKCLFLNIWNMSQKITKTQMKNNSSNGVMDKISRTTREVN